MTCKCGGTLLAEADMVDKPDFVMVRCSVCKKPHIFTIEMWEMLNK